MRNIRTPVQPSLLDAGTPLHEVAFVVVDLETTGGSPTGSRITEFGAVRIQGGEVTGEFHSLVDPRQAIPPAIAALTGITDAMVAAWPPVEAVLPAFLEFCRGTALVAHNARFDIGFLNANLARLDYPQLANPAICTAALARRLVRDEVRNCRLATLAHHFRSRTQPIHRALADARATVDVFHGLLERAGSLGVLTLDDLVGFTRAGSAPVFASRRRLADGLPRAPGIYAFKGRSGAVLYIGKATDLRARVRSYFGGDARRKIPSLLRETDAIDHWVCATPLEAAVREVRLIAAHRPHYNRRSTHPESAVWLRLTAERYPRLQIARTPSARAWAQLGPLPSKRVAEQVADALHQLTPLRRCASRIGPRTHFPACALAELGRCAAPCDGTIAPEAYADVVRALVHDLGTNPERLFARLDARMAALADAQRYEEAAAARDRLQALAAALDRTRRLACAAAADELVAAAPARTPGAVEMALVRSGRLVATASCAAADAAQRAEDLRAAAPPAELPGEPVVEELDLVARWIQRRATYVYRCDGALAAPAGGGAALEHWLTRLAAARRATGRPAVELSAKRRRAG